MLKFPPPSNRIFLSGPSGGGGAVVLPITFIDTVANLYANGDQNNIGPGDPVFVTDTNQLYVRKNTVANYTAADWQLIGAGVNIVPDTSSLPGTANDGELYLLQTTQGGSPYYRLVAWDDSSAADIALGLSATPPISDPDVLDITVTFPSGSPTATQNLAMQIDLTVSATNYTRNVTIPTGTTLNAAAALIQVAIGATISGLTATVNANVITLTPTAPDTLDDFSTITTVSGGSSGYQWINRINWIKQNITSPDQATDVHTGDVQFTLEADHEEIKVEFNNAWHIIYSRDKIQDLVAQLNHIKGTVQENGGSATTDFTISTLPNPPALANAGSYYIWNGTDGYVIQNTDTPVYPDLPAGLILNDQDYIVIVNRGGDGIGGNPAPDIHYSVIAGGNLTKQRADALYGMKDWVAGSYEKGSEFLYNGVFVKADRNILPSDPAPILPWTSITLTPEGTPYTYQITSATGALPTGLTAGNAAEICECTVAGVITGTGVAFEGMTYAVGDKFIFGGDDTVTGTTSDGHDVEKGWIYYPTAQTVPIVETTWLVAPETPYSKFDVYSDVRVVDTDGDLPAVAPIDQMYLVLNSALNNGEKALVNFNMTTRQWDVIGGGTSSPADNLPVGTVLDWPHTALPASGETRHRLPWPGVGEPAGSSVSKKTCQRNTCRGRH